MHFIDTHTHLYDEAFAGEEDQAVTRAVEAGVTKMILPDIDSQTREAMLALTERHEGTLFPCIGLHPTSVDTGWQNEMLQVEKHLDRKIYAIGEIGMDCYWSKEFVKEQEEEIKQNMVADGMTEYIGTEHKATYKEVISNRFDSTAFKKDHADMYEAYKKESSSMRSTFA